MGRRRLAALGVCVLCGCAGTSSGGGTQTNWVGCQTNEDCLPSQVCIEEVCRDRTVSDAGHSDAGNGDAATTGTSWLPPPGPYNCETLEPVTFTQGDGQCARPPIPASSYCRNACGDQPGAPGPDDCPPSIMEEFGPRCCYRYGCGFDEGSECRSSAELSDETVAAVLPCPASSSTPERIYEGIIDRVALTQDAIVIGRLNGETGSVTYVSKGTCAATEAYSMATVEDLAATDEAAYVIGYDFIAAEWVVLAVSPSGMVTKVPLAELFNAYAIYPENLVTSGTSVYVIVRVQESEAEPSSMLALAEIPCCGSPPRIIANDLATAWQPLIADAELTTAAVQGQTLVAAATDFTLDASRGSVVGAFDFATNRATLFFDFFGFGESMNPFAVADGRVYFVSGDRIVAMGVEDCALTTIATRPTAIGITALAFDGGNVLWAENYQNVAGARIFVKATDGAETRLAQVHDNVDWIGADSENVYWTMRPEAGPSKTLVRRRRP